MILSPLHGLILALGVAFAIGGVIVIRRIIPQEKLIENNEYFGFTYSILGLIYGIYLAFTIVVVWQQYADADDLASQEAVHVSVLWHDAAVFPADVRERIHRRIIAYTRSVVEKEWPDLRDGNLTTKSMEYELLWREYYLLTPDPNDPRQIAFYEESVDRLNEQSMARRQRIMAADAELPLSMWVLLITGAAGTIMFTWFYGTKYMSMQIAVTAFLSVVIIYSVLLVAMLQHPYGGEFHVKPTAFIELLDSFEYRADYR